MQDAVRDLAPEPIWRHFSNISDIPRKSGEEQRVMDYIRAHADAHGCSHETDKAGNVLVRKAATPGLEGAPAVALQGHVDMVCQANQDTQHDFSKDPIRLRRDGDWIDADGTTLGADNGIGCCAALALIEATDIPHPALEMIFTVEEETGLVGAGKLSFELAAETLVNLDTEEDGEVYIGCAGGQDVKGWIPVERDGKAKDWPRRRLALRGLKGGHSGVDIHLGRGSAVQYLARALKDLGEGQGVRLVALDGGTAHNAIPREADAVVALPPGHEEDLEVRLAVLVAQYTRELKGVDEGLKITVSAAEGDARDPMTPDCQTRVLDALLAIPHGVRAFSRAVPGLVETSNNIGVVQTSNEEVYVNTAQRSSVTSALTFMTASVVAVLRLAGARVQLANGYPGWEPDPDSRATQVVLQAMRDELEIEPKVAAIHAGLECGIIGSRYPQLDMVSFGPTVRDAHSPDERLEWPTVERMWKVLVATLAKLGEAKAS